MVEWKKLGEVCKIHTGSQLNRSDMLAFGPYPVVNGGREYSGYTDKFNEKASSITISQGGESAGFVNWIDVKFWAGAHCYVVEIPGCYDTRYIYHALKNKERDFQISKQGAGIPGLNRETLYKQIIPIPSLEEQTRIVGILDTFTSAIDNLKEQIAQRRKQYEYYRDQFLDLEGKPGVKMKTIGELFTFKNGLNKEKKFFGHGNLIVNYTDVFHNSKITRDILKGRVELSDSEIDRFRVRRGDVFFTRTSETKEEIGYAAVMLEEIDNCTFSGFLLRARPTTQLVLPEYCAYCFGSFKVRQEIIKSSTLTTRALTNGGVLSKISIPLPSLSEQQRIVSILDTFEASIKNLEAQLKQRQKQYEYYRNKLLTFERIW